MIGCFNDGIDALRKRVDAEIATASRGNAIATMQALLAAKEAATSIVFKDIYPIRFVLCWTDAIGVVIDACTAIDGLGWRSWFRKNGIRAVLRASGRLLDRIAVQASDRIANDDGVFDTFTLDLARDVVAVTDMQRRHRLFMPIAPGEFDDFMVKR
jgi:hypothetical protein